MPPADPRVQAFRNRHERLLRRLVTLGCCVSSCVNDGMDEQEEAEMNAFTKVAMDLVEAARRKPKRSVSAGNGDSVVLPLKRPHD